MSPSSLAPGVLLLMLGVFVITRSVTRDDTGRTLIDRVLGKPGMTPAAAAAARGGATGTLVTGRPGSAGASGGLAHGGTGAQTTVGRLGATSAPAHDLPHGAPGAVVR